MGSLRGLPLIREGLGGNIPRFLLEFGGPAGVNSKKFLTFLALIDKGSLGSLASLIVASSRVNKYKPTESTG